MASMTTLLAVSAATWGVLMALSPILQIRKMVQHRSSRDVSVGYFAVLIVGFVLWVTYGVSIDNLVLVIPNSVALVVAMTTVVIAFRYRLTDAREEELTAE
jgi:MtN3 and saliva related transmembrane protein